MTVLGEKQLDLAKHFLFVTRWSTEQTLHILHRVKKQASILTKQIKRCLEMTHKRKNRTDEIPLYRHSYPKLQTQIPLKETSPKKTQKRLSPYISDLSSKSSFR